jgi:hypothetical protein
MNGGHASTSEEHARALFEQVESQATSALDELVAKPSLGRLLAMAAENAAAVARITGDAADLILRNLRVAGRADITRLARQLHRTEDKLESVLQEVESLRDQLATTDKAPRDGRRSAVKRR